MRVRQFVSPRVAIAGDLFPKLVPCLISPRPRGPGFWLANLVTPFRGRWRAHRSDGYATTFSGSESDCVIVRNYGFPKGFTWAWRSTARELEFSVPVETDRPRDERSGVNIRSPRGASMCARAASFFDGCGPGRTPGGMKLRSDAVATFLPLLLSLLAGCNRTAGRRRDRARTRGEGSRAPRDPAHLLKVKVTDFNSRPSRGASCRGAGVKRSLCPPAGHGRYLGMRGAIRRSASDRAQDRQAPSCGPPQPSPPRSRLAPDLTARWPARPPRRPCQLVAALARRAFERRTRRRTPSARLTARSTT